MFISLLAHHGRQKTLLNQCSTVLNVDFFAALIEKIQAVGFAPLAPLEKSKATYTLHTVVRDQLGMAERREVALPSIDTKDGQPKQVEVHITSDMADVAYWDYRELRAFLTTIHNIMSEEVSLLLGKSKVAIAWAHDQSRTQDEIISLFQRLSLKHPQLNAPKPALKRLSAKLMVQNGRAEASIANTLAVLVANGSNYGDLLEQSSQLSLSNEALLDHLDFQVEKAKASREEIDKESLIPRELVIAYMKKRAEIAKSDLGSLTFCQFLNSINNSNNFAGNSDQTILSRLTALSRKKAESNAS